MLVNDPRYWPLLRFPLPEPRDGSLVVLDVAAVASAERYRRGGYVARPLRNLICLGLYFLGVPPRLIARIYR